MKSYFFIAVFLVTVNIAVKAQTGYTWEKDKRHPDISILTGIISKYILQNDSGFNSWYDPNQSAYDPDTSILTALESVKDKIRFIVFGGTWCEDTQFVLPRFFKLQELSGFPDSSIRFYGVNRAKKTLGNFAEIFKIKNVPTIIVLKEGIEIGRVVEYGTTGKWDKELADLFK